MKVLAVLCFFIATACAFPRVIEKDASDENATSFVIIPLFRTAFFSPRFHSVDDSEESTVLGGDSDESDEHFRPFSFNPFFSLFSSFPSFPSIRNFDDEGDNEPREPLNSTSTVKVVDGHKVTVNKTWYTSPDKSVHYQLRTVVILPEGQDDDASELKPKPSIIPTTSTSKPEDKSLENPGINEVDTKEEVSPNKGETDDLKA